MAYIKGSSPQQVRQIISRLCDQLEANGVTVVTTEQLRRGAGIEVKR